MFEGIEECTLKFVELEALNNCCDLYLHYVFWGREYFKLVTLEAIKTNFCRALMFLVLRIVFFFFFPLSAIISTDFGY